MKQEKSKKYEKPGKFAAMLLLLFLTAVCPNISAYASDKAVETVYLGARSMSGGRLTPPESGPL